MEYNRYIRQPSKRIFIKEIFEGYIDQGETPRVLKLNSGNKFHRLRILGIVINKFSRSTQNFKLEENKEEESEESPSDYTSIELDDGTGILNIRAWRDLSKDLDKFQIGDMIEVIGKPSEYQGIIYLQFEIGTKIDNLHWLIYHFLLRINELLNFKQTIELESKDKETNNIIKENEFLGIGEETESNLQNEELTEDISEIILELISDNTKGQGISVDKIKSKLKNYNEKEIKEVLITLLNEGLIYEPRPDIFKKL